MVLDTVCSPGTFVYAYEDHCRINVLSVVFSALVTVVLDSACSTDIVLCCMWDHYLTVCCHCTVIVLHGSCQVCVCRLASVVWLLRGGCYVLTWEVFCVGVNDTCGRLKTGVGGGGGLWLVGFQKCVEDFVGENSCLVAQVVVSGVLCNSVESFYSV